MKDIRLIGSEKKSWREKIRDQARFLRKNQTKSEKILWDILRNRKLNGYKFLRQHPFIYYIYKRPSFFFFDFYCASQKVVIELDGSIHDMITENDELRSEVLREKGISVLRIRNRELVDVESVKEKILRFIDVTNSPPCPPLFPREGEAEGRG